MRIHFNSKIHEAVQHTQDQDVSISAPSSSQRKWSATLGPKIKKLAITIGKIAQTALKVTGNILLGAFLYWTNPSICAVGFLIGLINHNNHVSHAIKKIKDVWATQHFSVCALGGFAAALSLPVTLAATSFLLAARFGEMMSQEAQRLLSANEQTVSAAQS